MTDLSKTAVTVLGLGAMGTALAETLLAAGHPTTVWNRTPEKADQLVAKGAVRAETVRDALAANRLVIVCLLHYASVDEVLGAHADALSGRVIVNLTNGTPGQARDMATWVTARDADYLDGGIMAVPPMIGHPGAFILYSGSRGAFDTYESLLGALAENHYLGTKPGQAALYDLALLSGMYGMTAGVMQAIALVRASGDEVSDFAPLLNRWLDSMSFFTTEAAKLVDSGDYSQNVVSNLGMQAAAYSNFSLVAAEQGVSDELYRPLGSLLERGVAAGYGEHQLASVIELHKLQD